MFNRFFKRTVQPRNCTKCGKALNGRKVWCWPDPNKRDCTHPDYWK